MNTNAENSNETFTGFIYDLFVQKIPDFLIKAIGAVYVAVLALLLAAMIIVGLIGIASLSAMIFGNVAGILVVVMALILLMMGPVPSWMKSFGQEVFNRFSPPSTNPA